MTLEEAKKIGTIIGHADGACEICVETLIDYLNEAFPEFVWTMPSACEPDLSEGSLNPFIAVQVAKAA